VADGKVSPTTPGPVYDDMFSPLRYFDALMQAGVQFDAVGLQLYFPCRDMLSLELILDEYTRFGKPIHITELGVRTASSGRNPVYEGCFHGDQVDRSEGEWHHNWSEKVQADWMEWFYTLCFARQEIKAITWWDFNDPGFIPTGGVTTVDGRPKESLFRLRTLRKNVFRC
jgi:endo-1,4-beta-xylanase